jgi:YD repeat-containing protein
MVVRANVRAWIVNACKAGRLALVGALAALFALTSFAAVGSSYLYDELGRLIEVTTTDGNTTQYSYDTSGNLRSVTSVGGTVTVVDFTPSSGAVGTSVVIYGSGFSTNASAPNTVVFGASTTAVSVVATSATQLTATVPADATTGVIKVSNGANTGTSANTFTVLAGTSAPTITQISPSIGLAGTAVTITGRKFDTTASNDVLSFGATQASVSSATAQTLQTTVPLSAGSGPIQLRTTTGTANSTDFYAVPPAYAASSVVAGSRVPVGGSATTPTLAAGQVAMMLFDLAAGQHSALSVTPGSGLTLASINGILVTDPHGQAFSVGKPTGNLATGAWLMPPVTLAGTYSAIVDLGMTNTGTVTLGLTPPSSTMMAIDQPSPLHLTGAKPTSSVVVTFNNPTPNKQVTLLLTANVAFSGDLSIVGPDGNTIVSAPNINMAAGQSYTMMPLLPMTGNHSVNFDANSGAAYDVTLYLNTSGTAGMTINGPPVLLTVVPTGGAKIVTFAATAGQQITVAAVPQSPPAGFTANLVVNDASGQALTVTAPGVTPTATVVTVPSYLSVDPVGMTNSGLYTVQLKPTINDTAPTSVQVTVSTPASTTSGTLPADGSAVPVSPTLAGQGATLAFAGNDHAMTLTVNASRSSTAYQAQVTVLDQFGLPVGTGVMTSTLNTTASGGTWSGSTTIAVPAFAQGTVYQVLVQQINASASTDAKLTFTLLTLN